MHDSIWRIMVLLASGRVSSQEAQEFFSFAKTENINALMELYASTRHQLRSDLRQRNFERPLIKETTISDFARLHRDIQFLVDKSNVKPTIAAREIGEMLRKTTNSSTSKNLKPLPKESFNRWLKRISNIVEPRDILRATTLALNTYNPRARSDWPLTSS